MLENGTITACENESEQPHYAGQGEAEHNAIEAER